MRVLRRKSIILSILLLLLFGAVISASTLASNKLDIEMESANIDLSSEYSQSILITQYLFTHDLSIGDYLEITEYYELAQDMPKYQVVDVITDDSGLDAFVIKTEKDELVLSIRGTEANAFDGDLLVDASLSFNSNPQYQALIDILKGKKYLNEIDYVIGHSLGGSVALNTSLWLISQNINLKDVYIYAPAPMIDDDYVTRDNINQLNEILHLVVLQNEILHDVGNKVASKVNSLNPYDLFDYSVVAIEGDHDNSFQNHYLDKVIPLLKGEKIASIGNVDVEVYNIEQESTIANYIQEMTSIITGLNN